MRIIIFFWGPMPFPSPSTAHLFIFPPPFCWAISPFFPPSTHPTDCNSFPCDLQGQQFAACYPSPSLTRESTPALGGLCTAETSLFLPLCPGRRESQTQNTSTPRQKKGTWQQMTTATPFKTTRARSSLASSTLFDLDSFFFGLITRQDANPSPSSRILRRFP